MKKIIKLIPILCLVLVLGCDSDDDNARFSNDPTTGWVEFATPTSGQTITIITEQVVLPVSVRVPNFQDGITINYVIEPVQGDFNSILTTGTSISLPAAQATAEGSPFVGNIELDFSGVSELNEVVIFDVVITSTDINSVGVGLSNSIVSYRISTPCPLDVAAIEGTYDVDEVFTSGVNAGLSLAAAFGESYQVEISLDPTDLTQTIFILTNSIGFNQFFVDGSTATLDTCNGTITFSDPLNLGDFADMVVEVTSYTESPAVMIADGPLGNFGPYQFILTKQ
ncbi:hypothetical protein ES692_16060 [Psychroserpens burtonensis]|uniref:Calx-beta domain-containing protein n=1 Tax=Psychroserpens burtonensis TaxID=49278 RepID=A0A5C7B6E7_9FLAO|nr:hypothetical protein [Psychroserpens burtonensis]TXE15552.1 hypothetical protein ES692_16060 [Psychroserpens burtonensis]